MRHLFAVLLLVLLPFQATWATAAGYCEHAPGAAVQPHFGHHEHIHMGSTDKPDDKTGLHGDCAVCHVFASQAVVTGTVLVADAAPDTASFVSISSLLSPGPVFLPERPQWPRLA